MRATEPEVVAQGGDRAKKGEPAASGEAVAKKAALAVMADSVTRPRNGPRTPPAWRTRHHRSSPTSRHPAESWRSPAPWGQWHARPCQTTLRTARQRSGCHQFCWCKTPKGRSGRRQSSRRILRRGPSCPHQAQAKTYLASRCRSPCILSRPRTRHSTCAHAKGGSHVSIATRVGRTGAGQAPCDHERCPHCHHGLLVCW